MNKLRTIQP